MTGSDGGIYDYGDAGFYGSAGGVHLNAPIVGLAATPDGRGYWLMASDGGIFDYGDAGFYGSLGGVHLNAPVVGIAATPDGRGYTLAAADGGIFIFGDAGFYGSLGGVHLNKPIVGIARSSDGKGYWMTASDGGIFDFGDAGFHGSAGGVPLSKPVSGITADFVTGGYWLVAQDGGVFQFDAPFYGSLPSPIVPPSPPPSGGNVTSAPPVTTSFYVKDLNGTASDPQTSRTDGCDEAKADSTSQNGRTSLVILDYGGQTPTGSFILIGPQVVLSPGAVATDAENWISGFVGCLGASTDHAVIAIGTNNSSTVSALNGDTLGGQVVTPVAQFVASNQYSRITVAGADDIEPGFGSALAVRAFLPAYLKYKQPMYDFGSADGCPLSGVDAATSPCNSGWTVGDVDYAFGQANPSLERPMPEIYYSVQATQFASLSRVTAPTIAAVGALSEYPTPGTNSPGQAWTQLFAATGQASLPFSSNI